jgi:hypothetical protein
VRVPTTDGGLVQRGDGVSQRFVAPDAGSGVGAGISDIGRAGQQFASVQDQLHAQLDEAGAKEYDTNFVDHSNGVLHDGPDAFFNKKGKDALLARQDVEDGLKTYATELVSKATTPRMKRMVQQTLDRRLVGIGSQVGSYTGQQTFEYNKDETAGRIAAATSAAGNSYLDPEVAEQNIATLRTEAGNFASMNGMGPEAASAFTLSKLSAARKDIASRLIAEDPRGPEVGKAYLDKHAADFTSDDAQYLTHYVRTQQDYYQAQAHKAEVEARQEQRERVKADADTAEDVLRRARFGPIPPDQMAAGLAAAQRAGKTGLAFELGNVAVTNKTKVVYQNATPAELQNRINELAPQTRGDSPDPVVLAEHRALNDMLGQTREQLQHDPISWGAAHMGLPTAPLNWNDQRSLDGRMRNAQMISARTGVQPKILTDEETATLAGQAVSHDPKVQAGLVFQLAKLGPQFGTIAARQVAPSDDRFAGLVGLATVPNRGVAQALVSKALQGPEIIKAHPKIIDKNFDSQFDGALGGLLRLMPGADRGVKEVAKNLLAANAAQNGKYESANSPTEVLASINGAFGGYNDHGVMRGGIGSHAGRPTVLPTGMSQDEFNLSIARSNGSQVLGASNGSPVWSNGKPIGSAKDLWGMELVPVGDGRYRLYNGAGYVTRKEGGFFELDVRKLGR